MLYLAGLKDDYVMDGRVLTELLGGAGHPAGLQQLTTLGACYKQLNASVGTFGTDTLLASSAALAGGSGGNDTAYVSTIASLTSLAERRDPLATTIKNELDQAEFHATLPGRAAVQAQLDGCRKLLEEAAALAT